MMPPVITSIIPNRRSKGLDRRGCSWHVSYQFCDLSADIAVYAENKAERVPIRSVSFAGVV